MKCGLSFTEAAFSPAAVMEKASKEEIEAVAADTQA